MAPTSYINFRHCWYQNVIDEPCKPNQVYVVECIEDPNQWFTFVELGNSSGVDEILIQTGNGGSHCFERWRHQIYLEPCNQTNPLQRFFARKGSFDGPKFELSQLGFESNCVTNAHHPKAGEVFRFYPCGLAESSTTGFYNKY